MLLCRDSRARLRLAFTVNPGQPRGMINAAWLSLLPGPARGGGADDDGPRGWAAVVAAWVAQAASRPSRPKV